MDTSSLPGRVVAISIDEQHTSLRLVETVGEAGDYVALSHSWGKSRPLVTLTANIKAFKEDISLDHLPNTFRDAVSITKELGFQYLWIDSLCIIQDSPEDWAVQSLHMASIYAGATITICATGSSSDEDGIFVTRSSVYQPLDNDTGLRDTRACATATAVVSLSSGKSSKLSFFPQRINDGGVGFLNHAIDPVTQDPLNSRAWAFQERILSPRKLMFGGDQMYWECKEVLFSEDGVRGRPNILLVEQVLNSETKQTGRERRKNGWPSIVTAYSERQLTYLTDKMPALAGLAEEIGLATSSKYYAGVWSSHLWQDLLWHVHLEPEVKPAGYTYVEDFKAYQEQYHGPIPLASEQKTHPWLDVLERWREIVTPDCPPLGHDTEVRMLRQTYDVGKVSKSGSVPKRTRPYVAPTWSFASIDAPVTYSYTKDDGLGIVAECIDVRTELAGPNEYGHIKNGSLTIKVGY